MSDDVVSGFRRGSLAVPHLDIGERRAFIVPAGDGLAAYRETVTWTACGRELPTTLATSRLERVRCELCRSAAGGQDVRVTARRRLWEIDHPYYGCSYNQVDFENFAELRECADSNDPDANFVYRWDWLDYAQPQHDGLFLPGEDRSQQQFAVCVLMPRKDHLVRWVCPVTHDQEAEVLAWLRGPRVLGRLWWEPLLDPAG